MKTKFVTIHKENGPFCAKRFTERTPKGQPQAAKEGEGSNAFTLFILSKNRYSAMTGRKIW